MDKWADVVADTMEAIIDDIASMIYRAAKSNRQIELCYCVATGTNPFQHADCAVAGCLSKQMAQPMETDDFPGTKYDIDYEHDCCPRIPYARDGTLAGANRKPRIEICLDCFHGAVRNRRQDRELRIYLEPDVMRDIAYGMIGGLVPDRVKQWLIDDMNVYDDFTSESSDAYLGQIVCSDAESPEFRRVLESTRI